MTTSNLVNEFIKHLRSQGRSESTIIAYRKDIEQLSDYQKGELNKATQKDLENFVEYLIKEKGFTNKTASRKINSFKTFYKYLLKEGKLESDPAKEIKHPEFENTPQNTLSTIEYKALRDTAKKNLRLATLIELLLQTGARIGEISRLKVGELKLDSNPPLMVVSAFESNPMRVVELNSVAVEAIKNYLSANKSKTADDFLFTTRTGKNLLVRNMRTAIDRIFDKAGIKSARVNDLRNTFIVHQLENGMSLQRLAELVGHKRITSTERYLPLTTRKLPGKSTKIAAL